MAWRRLSMLSLSIIRSPQHPDVLTPTLVGFACAHYVSTCWIVGYTEMCIQRTEVGGTEVESSTRICAVLVTQRALYSPGVACAHIESLPTCSAVEVIRRPYRSSRFSALYLAHSFSVRVVNSGEAIPNRSNDRIVARTLMLCRC